MNGLKRIIVMLTLCIGVCISTKAETIWYQAYQYAQAVVYNGNYTWSDWKSSTVKMKIEWDNDLVVIYSPKTQIYKILEVVEPMHADAKGGQECKFRFIDGDGDRGSLRLRIDPYGAAQVYINFSNIAWVYCVKKI